MMKRKMKFLILSAIIAVSSICVSAAEKKAYQFVPDAKNCIQAKFRDLPADFEKLLVSEPEIWNFGFRPYGSSASQLWTDPILQREALTGGETEGKKVVALSVSCSVKGFSILVFRAEPDLKKSLAEGKRLPSGSLECFFAPGDADIDKIEHYYQFMLYATKPKVSCYPWFVDDRNFRSIENHITAETKILSNGYITKIDVPWEPLFDRLPFTDRKDSFWRLSVIANGQTWGGVVHQANQAGYIRWPEFTQAQKTAIMKNLLWKAWNAYQNESGSIDLAKANIPYRREPYYLEKDSKLPHSYKLYVEDFAFREPWLENAVAERNALGAKIVEFEKLSPAEQITFYKKAADMLFNYRYDVEEAYRKHMKKSIFKR